MTVHIHPILCRICSSICVTIWEWLTTTSTATNCCCMITKIIGSSTGSTLQTTAIHRRVVSLFRAKLSTIRCFFLGLPPLTIESDSTLYIMLFVLSIR